MSEKKSNACVYMLGFNENNAELENISNHIISSEPGIHYLFLILKSLVQFSSVAQSCLTLCDPWTVAHQAPPSMGFSRQEYWSGLPFPSPGDLPNPGVEPGSPALQADALTSEPPGKSRFH